MYVFRCHGGLRTCPLRVALTDDETVWILSRNDESNPPCSFFLVGDMAVVEREGCRARCEGCFYAFISCDAARTRSERAPLQLKGRFLRKLPFAFTSLTHSNWSDPADQLATSLPFVPKPREVNRWSSTIGMLLQSGRSKAQSYQLINLV